MTTTISFLAAALILIVLPIVILLNLTESRHTKIARARRNGQTWQAIANRYQVSTSTVRRWSIA